jgi:[acyl-carrier-protein] S-malonyltransferase
MNPGTMAAVISLPEDKISEICNSCEGIVVPANYNSKIQIVISGEVSAIEQACAKMKEAGARRALVLPVGGAFHSPLMEPARQELAECIERIEFKTPLCPIYQNVTALPTMDPELIKENLLKQLTSSVRWTHTIENMILDGATEFIEVGPGTVLQGLVSQISSEVNAYSA